MDKLIGQSEPTAEQTAIRDRVLGLAARHAAGTIDHWEVRRQSTGHDRYVATRYTALDDPLRPALMAMLDDLIANDPTNRDGWCYQTPFGTFTAAELESVGARFEPHGKGFLIQFPNRYTADGPEYRGEEAAS